MADPDAAGGSAIEEILIIKPSSLGDVVHTLPSAGLLRRAFPSARIHWLIGSDWAPLLEMNPHLTGVVEFPRRKFRGVAGLIRIAPWARSLRKRLQPDLVLDYQGLLRSALMARCCRGRATRVLGLSDAREGSTLFYDQVADVSRSTHAVDRYLTLTRTATGHEEAISKADLAWPLPAGTPHPGFHSEDRFIVLHPFSRGVGKSLDASEVGEFCRSLPQERIVIVGRSEVDLPRIENAVNLLNQTDLAQLTWLLRHARFIVSVDSGPMHIAAALTERLVAIHTWSDPAKVGPYRDDAWVWKNGALYRQRDMGNPAAHREVAKIGALAEFVKTQI